MTKNELIAYCRRRSRDTESPYRTSDDEINVFLEEAEKEAFERAKLGKFNANISTVIGTDSYAVNSLYFDIVRLKIGSTNLRKTTRFELDHSFPGWESESDAKPGVWFQEGMRIYLYPSPDAVYTVNLEGFRHPQSQCDLETPEHLHINLADWVLYRIYTDKDPDGVDLALGTKHLGDFERVFGTKPSARLSYVLKRTSQEPAFLRSEF